MPRYALLRHEVPATFGRPSHWDLLLEQGDICEAWAIEVLPIAWAERLKVAQAMSESRIEALRLHSHRKHYLDYEGPVGNNRGTVARVATGDYLPLGWTSTEICITCLSGHLRGTAQISIFAPNKWELKVPPTAATESRLFL